jgi:hypothetical protein
VAPAARGARRGRPLLPSPPRPKRSATGMTLVQQGGDTSDSDRHRPPPRSASPSSTGSARWRATKQGWRSRRRPAARAARRAPSPSTAARRARTRAPWPMGGTTRVNGSCAVSWAEGLAHSTVWHGGTARWLPIGPMRPRVEGPRQPCRRTWEGPCGP